VAAKVFTIKTTILFVEGFAIFLWRSICFVKSFNDVDMIFMLCNVIAECTVATELLCFLSNRKIYQLIMGGDQSLLKDYVRSHPALAEIWKTSTRSHPPALFQSTAHFV